ncbi:bifunctional phosphoserine phosphatase/homoserine phosphotransferase ThrH [Bordetella ansorpii]|nr:bifunctional phosphoserine phosphatase/homoserine phosphotransferase ThrH [Bordetella ansorpii]
MKIACIDLEGVLIPELWPIIGQSTGVQDFAMTTRDEPDYPTLMRLRITALRKNGLRLKDVQAILLAVQPFLDARHFLEEIGRTHQVQIVSDCFHELASPLLKALGDPQAYCHSLCTDSDGWVVDCCYLPRNGKEDHIARLLAQGMEVLALGDAFNDLKMLRLAQQGFLVRPSLATQAAAPDIPVVQTLQDVLAKCQPELDSQFR